MATIREWVMQSPSFLPFPHPHLLMLLIFNLWLQYIQTAINSNKNTVLTTSHFVPLNPSWQNWLLKVTLKHPVIPQPFHLLYLYPKLDYEQWNCCCCCCCNSVVVDGNTANFLELSVGIVDGIMTKNTNSKAQHPAFKGTVRHFSHVCTVRMYIAGASSWLA